MRSQAANEHFTLIYSCLGLQATAHLCGQVMAMELAALFSLSHPESCISHSKYLPMKTADVHKTGKRPSKTNRQTSALHLKCIGCSLNALPL